METSYSPHEEALARYGDRISSETKAVQARLLEILKVIHQTCQEHGLTYYLLSGSCLGAVRHQGFIPWDDDADIGLPRPDYDLLVAHAAEWLPEDYELVSGATCPNYPYSFSRIQDRRTTYILRRSFDFVGGLPVDVFPLDGMTASGWRRRWHYLRLGITKKLLYFRLVDPCKHGHGLHFLLSKTVRALWRAETLHRRLDRIQREFDYASSPFIVDHDFKASKGIYPRSMFGSPTIVPFADTELATVSTPDAYLRLLYGDYMQLPSQLPPCNYRFLDLEKPYLIKS